MALEGNFDDINNDESSDQEQEEKSPEEMLRQTINDLKNLVSGVKDVELKAKIAVKIDELEIFLDEMTGKDIETEAEGETG